MAKRSDLMDVYILGKGSKAVAIVDEVDAIDVPQNPLDSTFHSLSNNWGNTPKQYALPSRSEQLKILLDEFNMCEKRRINKNCKAIDLGRFYTNKFIEYLEWEEAKDPVDTISNNSVWYKCKKTIKRAEDEETNISPQKSTSIPHRTSRPYIVALCDSKSSPITFSSFTCLKKNTKKRNYQETLLNRAEYLVVRTSLSELVMSRSGQEYECELNSFKGRESPKDVNDRIVKHIMDTPKLAEKTIALVTIDSLREHGLNIRKGLSWDQMFTETIKELERFEAIDKLQCLIVVFHHEGCLVRFSEDKKCVLFCSPTMLESAFEAKHKNTPHSSMTLLQAVVIQGLNKIKVSGHSLESKEGQNLFCEYIYAGLEMRIDLLEKGYIYNKKNK